MQNDAAVPDDTVAIPYPPRRESQDAFPAVYRHRQRACPVSRTTMADGREAWLLTRYEDVKAVLTDDRFDPNRLNEDFPAFAAGQLEGLRKQPQFMISLDGKEHAAVRKRIVGEFSVRRVEQLRPVIQEIVDEAIARIRTMPQPVDLVEEFALRVPTTLLARMIGADTSDHEYFRDLVHLMLWRGTKGEERVETSRGLRRYFDELIRSKMDNPGDDILSRQIELQRREDGVVDTEGLCSLAQLLLIAGYESSAAVISLAVYTLLARPELREEYLGREDRLSFVDEVLRYYSVLDVAAGRAAKTDLAIGDTTIHAGDAVIASTFCANRDAEVFPEPDEFDMTRPNLREHLAFGWGPHMCLGANLARVELEIVLDSLLVQFPALALADGEEPSFKFDALAFGMYSLPVVW